MIGRPHPSEAASFYATYIDLILTDDPLIVMEDQLEEVEEIFSTISEEKSLYRYAPDKWSIRQLLNHVTDTERAFAFRALWFARGFADPLPSYDQDIAAAGAQANSIPLDLHIDEFGHVRLASIALFRNLPAGAWMRTGTASGNPFTVRSLAYIICGHVAHHLRVLRERYLVSS
jgi:hypothetical protein